MDTKWDLDDLKKMKRGAVAEMDIDIQRLKKAVDLISKVEETLSAAFWEKVSKMDKPLPTLELSSMSGPARLAKAMSEITMVAEALQTVKNRI
jgi:hypothetical protein